MITTALAADEPPEPRPSFATGGVIPAGSVPLIGDEGCALTLPVDSSHTDTAGNVHVTVTIPDGPLAESLRSSVLGHISLGARHCCACATVCHHISPAQLRDRHIRPEGNPSWPSSPAPSSA